MESEKPTARAGRRGSGGNVRIDLAALPVQIQIAGEQISSQLVKWFDYTARVINTSSTYLRASVRATLALVCLNIIFFEVAVVICAIVNKLFNCFYLYSDLSENGKLARSIVLGSVFVIAVVGANSLFQTMLNISLPRWWIVFVAASTDLVWMCWL